MKLLLQFHQLSELALFIYFGQDLNHIAKCFSRLHNLRKLTIGIRGWDDERVVYRSIPNPINDIGMIIGANINLTHLELFQSCGVRLGGNLAKIFAHVPSNSPLKLEYLGLSTYFSNLEAIAPHARLLKSIYLIPGGYGQILTIFRAECIFPPIIQVSYIYESLIDYLNHHPQIVGLSIHNMYNEPLGRMMLETMVQHSESLKDFCTPSSSFLRCLKHVQNELLFLRFTNLEKLTLLVDVRIEIEVVS